MIGSWAIGNPGEQYKYSMPSRMPADRILYSS